MTVYLPSSYTTNKNKRFPVLYLAKGFDPVTIKEQLTIAVLSIDSFAATDKESRHVRRENSNLPSSTRLADGSVGCAQSGCDN